MSFLDMITPGVGSLLSGGVSALSSIFNTSQNNDNAQKMQQQAEAYNTQMVQQQQAFETQMSNSAHQRETADLRAAGLNPILSAGGGGASTPSISAPTIQPAQRTSAAGAVGDALSKIIPNAVALKTANATIDNLVEQNAKIKAEAATEREKPALISSETDLTKERKATQAYETANKSILGPILRDQALSATNRTAIDPTIRRLADQAGFAGKSVGDALSPISNLVSSAYKAKNLFSERYSW